MAAGNEAIDQRFGARGHLGIFEHGVYDPAFGRSFGLKAVSAALLGLGSSAGSVTSGVEAQEAFEAMREADDADRETLRAALLDYCEQDTRCLVELLRVLEGVVRRSPRP